jgi:hypothetical protein
MALLGITDTDVAALGGVGTLILSAVALLQIRESRRQTNAMSIQTDAMKDQVSAIKDVADKELAAMREDVQASIEQGHAVREAARAQNQPIVFAHAAGIVKGPDTMFDVGAGEVGFRYRLINEGTGVALNIRHGLELSVIVREYGEGMEVRSMRPAEQVPEKGDRSVAAALMVVFREDELPADWHKEALVYWASFENVFGESFKTANPHDPHQSAAFMRVEELPSEDP